MSVNWPERLNRREASLYLRERHGIQASAPTLANFACHGGGPAYRRQGGRLVIYEQVDLDSWAETRLSRKVRATAELRSGIDAKITVAARCQNPTGAQPASPADDQGGRQIKVSAAGSG